MAHDRDPRDLEVRGDVTRDPWPLAEKVEDSAPRRIGEGEPNAAAISVELSLHIAGRFGWTRNVSITYRSRQSKEGDAR